MLGRLFWKLFLGNALLETLMLVTCVWLITTEVDKFYQEDLTTSLYSQAEMLRHLTADRFDRGHAAELQRLAHEISHDDPAGLRITFIAADGTVLADSEVEAAGMEPHSSRGEVRAALNEGWGQETRLSHTLDRPMKYLAVRIGPAEKPAGVVRVAMPLRTIGQRAENIRRLLWSTAAVALAAALVFALGLARLWSAPIRRITLTARKLSRGDLSARVPVVGNDELTILARALNDMRGRLAGHLETIDRQHKTLQSLLAQLQEGVVVAGSDGRIVLMNPAAERLLGAPAPESAPSREGAAVETCVPQHSLQQMLLLGARAQAPLIQEVQLRSPGSNGKLSVLASACDIALPGTTAGETITGRLLVLTDVTPLAWMMQVKADFAANASHELRTPLSAIRAAVETLLQMDLTGEIAPARQFIDMIERHSSRMEAMVADLLNLSKIESSPSQFRPVEISLREMLDELQRSHAERLESKRLQWTIDAPVGPVPIIANPDLLRLVLENLVDNAINFTEPGGHVRLICRREPASPDQGPPIANQRDWGPQQRVVIEVADDGCGIPEDEQERVFERFYQVQRARSGSVRGTGLGLSIVRHAVAAMNGTVTLKSRLAHGTTVTISLPQNVNPTDAPAHTSV